MRLMRLTVWLIQQERNSAFCFTGGQRPGNNVGRSVGKTGRVSHSTIHDHPPDLPIYSFCSLLMTESTPKTAAELLKDFETQYKATRRGMQKAMEAIEDLQSSRCAIGQGFWSIMFACICLCTHVSACTCVCTAVVDRINMSEHEYTLPHPVLPFAVHVPGKWQTSFVRSRMKRYLGLRVGPG